MNCTVTTIASKQTEFYHEIKSFAQVDFTRGLQRRHFTLSFSTLIYLTIAGLTIYLGIVVSRANDSRRMHACIIAANYKCI